MQKKVNHVPAKSIIAPFEAILSGSNTVFVFSALCIMLSNMIKPSASSPLFFCFTNRSMPRMAPYRPPIFVSHLGY